MLYERSVASGPGSSGSSPKCRELSLAIPASCFAVACSYDTCCATASCRPKLSSNTGTTAPYFHAKRPINRPPVSETVINKKSGQTIKEQSVRLEEDRS